MIKRFATLTAGLMLAFGTLGSPAHATTGHRAPDASERQELRDAQRASGSGYTCHLEWDGPAYNGYEAICVRKPAAPTTTVQKAIKAATACSVPAVWRKDIGACVALYLRPAHWDKRHTTYTPQGGALVAECLEQYRGVELHDCLRQPA